MPGVWTHQFENKKGKLAQLAGRIWDVTYGDEDAQAKSAIENTIEYFHSVEMPTRLGDYNITEADIQKVVDRFEKRGTVAGEHKNIKAPQVAEILKLCL